MSAPAQLFTHLPEPAANSCRILWIRHGETAWNTEKRFQGHLDIPLNDTGHLQARQLAARLHSAGEHGALKIHSVHSSDLTRAEQTAQALNSALGFEALALGTHAALRERHYGALAGLTADEMAQQHPEVYKKLTQRDPQAPLPGGESLQAFYDRITQAAQALALQHIGHTLAVVVHGGVLDCIYRHTQALPLQPARTWLLANTSVNVIDHSASGWLLRSWGDTLHLEHGGRDEVDQRVA